MLMRFIVTVKTEISGWRVDLKMVPKRASELTNSSLNGHFFAKKQPEKL